LLSCSTREGTWEEPPRRACWWADDVMGRAGPHPEVQKFHEGSGGSREAERGRFAAERAARKWAGPSHRVKPRASQ